MLKPILKVGTWIIGIILLLVATIYFVRAFDARDMMPLRVEHRITLEYEFRAAMEKQTTWKDYLELEDSLAKELSQKLESRKARTYFLDRHTQGSPVNPDSFDRNWNRSYVLEPDVVQGSAVFLHGLTDSPYSVRATAELFRKRGLLAFAPRMPGHGFAVGSLRQVNWQDWLSVVRITMREADRMRDPNQPLILAGYSNGGLLAIRYVLDCLVEPELPCPDGILLISPAIDVTPFARLANWHSMISWLPYFENFQWESILPEIDPFKFTSFPKNPGWEIYKLVKSVQQDLSEFKNSGRRFPVTLSFQSLVDDTVSTSAAIKFFLRLQDNNHEMVIYDVNRHEAMVELMNEQPPDLITLMQEQAPFNFTLSLLTNSSPDTQNVHIVKLKSGSREPVYRALELEWPNSVFSLSHIALPFTPEDPVYGESGPHQQINLGMLSPRGERNVLNLNPDYFLRLRHNPFYDYQKDHISVWIEQFIQ